MSTEVRCPECSALKGHSPKCSLIDLETAKSLLHSYYNLWLTKGDGSYYKIWKSSIERIKALKNEVTFWRGKFNDLRHENNKLRNKILKL
jgi:hypothetical protein